jgi:hypothetical protein
MHRKNDIFTLVHEFGYDSMDMSAVFGHCHWMGGCRGGKWMEGMRKLLVAVAGDMGDHRSLEGGRGEWGRNDDDGGFGEVRNWIAGLSISTGWGKTRSQEQVIYTARIRLRTITAPHNYRVMRIRADYQVEI